MSKLNGAILVLAGVAVAAYTLSSRHDTDAQIAAPQPGSEIKETVVGAGDPKPPSKWQAEVTTSALPQAAKVAQPPPVAIAEAPARTPVFQYKPTSGPPLDRVGLTREIQRHLKRISCYQGAVDGVWSPSVRRAMKAFTDRVNAALPTEQPDYILLAMLQNHQHVTCGPSCPAGQGLAEDGRCLPNALVARAGKRQAPAKAPDDGRPPPAAVIAVVPADPADGRMLLAGPPAERAAKGPTQAKAPPSAIRRKHTASYGKSAGPRRHADTRARDRRFASRGYNVPSTGFGFPWWGVPGIMP